MSNSNRDHACQSTADGFTALYGYYPEFVALAPGRVNLIGEHVDHQGYSVLPAALNQTIQVAIGLRCNESAQQLITLTHAKSHQFPTATFKSLNDLKVSSTPIWSNYIVASLLGIIEYKTDRKTVGQTVARFKSLQDSPLATAQSLLPKCGIEMLVDGNVPLVCMYFIGTWIDHSIHRHRFFRAL